MKVLLESLAGTQFPVKVGDSGTLQELKEKVQETLDIPIARQILSFNGNILRQDTDLVDVENGSVIKFRIIPAPEPEAEANMNIQIQFDISPTERITVKMCGDNTVYQLKEKIRKKEGTPTGQILLTSTEYGTELAEEKRLRDCDLESGVELEFLAEPRPAENPDMLRLELQFNGEKLPAAVEVMKWEWVKELRPRLDAMEFKVPGNVDFCFIRGEDLLDENSDFASNRIANGDLIRITTGDACYLRRYVP